jgi:hypothetical protein
MSTTMIVYALTSVFVVAASTYINRLAGGGFPINLESVQNSWYSVFFGRFQCAVYLFLVSLLVQPWEVALVLASGFFFWRLFSWGYLIGGIAGGHKPNREPRLVEGTLLKIFGPIVGMAVRMLFVVPCLAMIAFITGNYWILSLSIPFAILGALSYVLAWKYTPSKIIDNAELGVGMLWGLLILLV